MLRTPLGIGSNRVSIFAVSLLSILVITGVGFSLSEDSTSESADSISEFSSAFVQLASATEIVPECSGNGFEDESGSCMCKARWSGSQCEVSGG